MNPITLNMDASYSAQKDAEALRRCMCDRFAEAAEFAESAAEACGPEEEPLRSECWLMAAQMYMRAEQPANAIAAARRGLEGTPASDVASTFLEIVERLQ